MHLRIFTITLLILLSSRVAAQSEFGVTVGLKSSTHKYSVDDVSSSSLTKPLIGFQFGFWMSQSLSEKIDLTTELLYSKEGFQFDLDTSSVVSNTFKVPINIVNLNTGIGYNITNTLKLKTGPEIGYLISSKWDINGNQFDVDYYKKISFGWNFSLSYEFDFPVTIGLRYHQGLHDISNDAVIVTNSMNQRISDEHIDEVKRNFQLNLYYQF